MEDVAGREHPGWHQYAPPRGLARLREAILEKVRSENRLPAEADGLLVTAGATGALSAALGALLDPGEEVLVLAPYWPLIPGIVRAWGGEPVEVPFYDRVGTPQEAAQALGPRAGARTVGLYVSTPSNPTGRVLSREILEGIARFARERDLWILSDEVYEAYVYRGQHVSIGELAPERTLTVFSFSKTYAMAGNRVGYLVGPPEAVDRILRVATHTVYCAPAAGQIAALRALERGRSWLEEVRARFQATGEEVARRLGVDPPQGSTFLFLDIRQRLDERGPVGFLEDALEAGLAVAPGSACGRDYAHWIRICYTVVPPADALEAAAILARLLGRAGRPGG
jgi:N-succinyldiaminopimelate aminotransferase